VVTITLPPPLLLLEGVLLLLPINLILLARREPFPSRCRW
jgi:hypothetical protein